MIVSEGKKYACDKCMRGHRSSSCEHSDRPLVEIKRKGRPKTQCNHCREIRNVRQVHVDCRCLNNPLDPATGQPSCCCSSGTDCQCISPRKKKKKRNPKNSDNTGTALNAQSSSDASSSTTIQTPHMFTQPSPVSPYEFHDEAPFSPFPNLSQVPFHFGSPMPSSSEPQLQVGLPLPNLELIDLRLFCVCGVDCQCAGCQLRPLLVNPQPPPTSVFCASPYSCTTCLDCAIISH